MVDTADMERADGVSEGPEAFDHLKAGVLHILYGICAAALGISAAIGCGVIILVALAGDGPNRSTQPHGNGPGLPAAGGGK